MVVQAAMPMIQVLQENGKKDQHKVLGLSDADALKMYTMMVLGRTIDQRLTLIQRQGRIGFFLEGTGQEAVQVGIAYPLQTDDWVFPHYRGVGVPLVRGAAVQDIVNQAFGNADDLIKGRQMPIHYSFKEVNYFSISSPLGVRVLQGAGAAHAMQIQGKKSVVLANFGDGSTSAGDWHCAMNFAGVFNAPIVFICENNQYAISVPKECQTRSETYAQKAIAYGFEGVRVDGNDLLAVYKATKDAAEKARKGGGPTLIECYTYRLSSHSTSDDATRYRSAEEVEMWKKKDPILRFGNYLKSVGLLTDAKIQSIQEDCEEQVKNAITKAADTPMPDPQTMLDDVYLDPTPRLRRQRERLAQELGGGQ